MTSISTLSEADILASVVAPAKRGLTPDAARSFLTFKFDAAATKRIRQLLQKNNRGIISESERVVLERYLRVGQLLDLLHAKAKLSLHQAGEPS
jgi:hypothetical protein